MAELDRWRGRVALVTGASSGIGRAVAQELLRAGMRVALCARRGDRLVEAAAECGAAPESSLLLAADLRDPDAVRRVFEQIRAAWGGVDVLVNNAGVGYKTPLLDGDFARWREMVELNVLALCQCSYEAVADMRRRGDDGHVILISSIGAYRHKPGSVGNGLYVATKAAVRSLTESLRIELRSLGSGIRISAVSPGLVETEFAGRFHQDEAQGQAVYRTIQTLQSEDVAEIVSFLLSNPPHVQIHDVIVRPTEQMS
jgi:NADP-dependent 3-hydroxy acid dehydrogenase YdfG